MTTPLLSLRDLQIGFRRDGVVLPLWWYGSFAAMLRLFCRGALLPPWRGSSAVVVWCAT